MSIKDQVDYLTSHQMSLVFFFFFFFFFNLNSFSQKLLFETKYHVTDFESIEMVIILDFDTNWLGQMTKMAATSIYGNPLHNQCADCHDTWYAAFGI